VLIAAAQDKYVPARSVAHIRSLWEGSEYWCIDGGHVTGFLFAGSVYRSAICHALRKLPESQRD
jgi:poly(3-hydroxyalkanoate) synthetase